MTTRRPRRARGVPPPRVAIVEMRRRRRGGGHSGCGAAKYCGGIAGRRAEGESAAAARRVWAGLPRLLRATPKKCLLDDIDDAAASRGGLGELVRLDELTIGAG